MWIFSTHKSPICMHFTISDVEPDSIKKLSTNSNTLSSFHSLHAYEFRLQMELYFISAVPFPFLSNSNSIQQKLTYVCKECLRMFSEIETTTPFSTNNLKQDYTKAEDIGFNRKYSFHCIFWSHVPTFWIPTSLLLLLLF